MAQSQVWSQGRGFERLLARETNISDLIQFCTERDPGVWEEFVGFTPDIVGREERPYGKRPAGPGIADIVLRRDENRLFELDRARVPCVVTRSGP